MLKSQEISKKATCKRCNQQFLFTSTSQFDIQSQWRKEWKSHNKWHKAIDRHQLASFGVTSVSAASCSTDSAIQYLNGVVEPFLAELSTILSNANENKEQKSDSIQELSLRSKPFNIDFSHFTERLAQERQTRGSAPAEARSLSQEHGHELTQIMIKFAYCFTSPLQPLEKERCLRKFGENYKSFRKDIVSEMFDEYMKFNNDQRVIELEKLYKDLLPILNSYPLDTLLHHLAKIKPCVDIIVTLTFHLKSAVVLKEFFSDKKIASTVLKQFSNFVYLSSDSKRLDPELNDNILSVFRVYRVQVMESLAINCQCLMKFYQSVVARHGVYQSLSFYTALETVLSLQQRAASGGGLSSSRSPMLFAGALFNDARTNELFSQITRVASGGQACDEEIDRNQTAIRLSKRLSERKTSQPNEGEKSSNLRAIAKRTGDSSKRIGKP